MTTGDAAPTAEPEGDRRPGDRGRDTRIWWLVLALIVCAFALHALRLSWWLIDDAYISFRYARNLADGHGLVFNLGDRVEGYTNFAWVVLAAIGLRLGASPVWAMPAIGVLAAGSTIVLAARGARRLSLASGAPHPAAGLIAAATLAAATDLARYAVSGLETALFALLVTGGALALSERRPYRFGVFAGLAFLTRPEGALLALVGVALLAFVAFGPAPAGEGGRGASRARATVAALVLAAFVVPYLGFKWIYFGALLPNTLSAKPPGILAGARYVATALPPLSGLLLAAVIGARKQGIRTPAGELLGLFVIFVVAAGAEGGDWMDGHRMLVQTLPLLAIAADGPILDLLARGHARRSVRSALLGTALFVCFPLFSLRQTRELAVRVDYMAQVDLDRHRVFSRLHDAGVRSLGTFDVGLPAWDLPDVELVDLGGLTDRVIARAPGYYYDKRPAPEYLARRAPDAFLFSTNVAPIVDRAHGSIAIASHYPCEDEVKALPWFIASYAYRETFPIGGMETYYLHWFARRGR